MAEVLCDPLHCIWRDLTPPTLKSILDAINATHFSTHTKPPSTQPLIDNTCDDNLFRRVNEKHQFPVDQIRFILRPMENPGPWWQVGHGDGETFGYRSENL